MVATPRDLDPAVRTYYELGREQRRLESSCRLEFIRTQELLHRYLPPAPARILDVGGGAGAHALPLSGQGYDIVLVDPVPLHVDQARAAGLTAELGDARDLRFDDESFDAVLLLGPLYHLPERGDRVRAIGEARRVVVSGGVVIAAVISRFASTLDGLHHRFLLDDRFEQIVERDVATGRHENPDDVPGWFTTAYFHHPSEVSGEFVDAGCTIDALLAIEGPATSVVDVDAWLDDPAQRDTLLRAIRRTEAEPSLLGLSSHVFVASRRDRD